MFDQRTPTASAPVISRYLPLLLAVSVFMQLLDATILNTALPVMAQDLNESPLQMQSAIIAYALTMALLMPLSGYLSDRFGTKPVFLSALSLFTMGSALCAAAYDLNTLIIARIIQGMGGSMLLPVPRLIILRAYQKNEYLSKMNFVIMPALLGPIFGPLIGGYLVEYVSWHWIFLINLPIGILGLIAACTILPNFASPEQDKPRLDHLGFLLFATGAAGLTLAVETMGRNHHFMPAIVCAIVGMFAWLAYLYHAKKHGVQALYPLQLKLIRTFRIGILGNIFSRLGMAAVPVLLPLLLQLAFNYPPSASGWLLVPIALAAMFAKPFVKPLVRHFGYRNVLTWNSRAIGILIFSLAFLDAQTPLWQVITQLFLLGMCNSIQYSSMNTLTLSDLRVQQAASGNSLMAVNQQLAISFGIALGATLLHIFVGLLPENSNPHPAFQNTFQFIGSITFLSSWIFTRLHRRDGSSLTT